MSHDMGDGSPGACPDDETLAAYVDNRLDPADREQLERHAADCDICSALLGGVSAQLHAGRGTRARLSRQSWLAIAASLVLLTSVGLVLASRWPRTAGPAEESLRAMRTDDTARSVEGRLSGFPYAPFVRQTRSASPAAAAPAFLAAEGAVQNVPADPDPANLYVRGVAWLLTNDLDASVRDLEAALAIDASNVRVLNALSVASLARADSAGDQRQLNRALEFAERAIRIDPAAAEPRFNKALALEKLGRRDSAILAWREVPLDGSSWQREVERRRSNLTRDPSIR